MAVCSEGSKWLAGIIPGSIVEVIITKIDTKICSTTETMRGAQILLSYMQSCFIGKAAKKEAGILIKINVNIRGLTLFLCPKHI